MNLHEDIEKLTLMPSCSDDNGAQFVRVNGPGRADQDRQMNKKRPVPVRYRNGSRRQFPSDDEDDKDNDNYDDDDGDDDNDSKKPDISRISLSVRTMNVRGNRDIEKYFQQRQQLQEEETKAAEKKQFSQAESQGNDNSTMSRLWKNGVIRGLVNQKIISKSDLVNNTNDEREIPKEKNSNLVEDPNDQDLLLHPLLAYGKLTYDEEFILPRVGKKTTVTPRDHLKSMVDEDFEFVKKTK
ncbi:zinc-regulated protein 8-like [Leptopilina heterotoma]|uniref:zinc-regulated protein 8-like n=1 Tax=Leptopilina heterotoma TaxID=63436 RepID=UPI001CA8BA12|nr:zinc-regulated protein 8-like [Leptopilina heterotoma]